MEEEFERIDRENSWGIVYQFIRYKSRDHHLSYKEAKKPINVHLNRYKDVYPYDHSRVHLARTDIDYINANLVPVPEAKRAYILTQGPLPMTTGHFWAMVWEQQCKGIIMLNRIVEKNMIKCHQYWPSDTGDENKLVLDDVNLEVINQREEIAYNYIIRELLLVDLEAGESRIIYHFHYVTWPDFGVPESPETFLQFLQVVREKGVLDMDRGPPVVHCSAGIGRSGTFCLVDSCLVMIENTRNMDTINIKDILLQMRKYRMGLIQTPDQLRFSYLAIIEGAKTILRDNEPPPLPQKQKFGEILDEKLSEEYISDQIESEVSEETSEESVSIGEDDVSEDDTISMHVSQEQDISEIEVSEISTLPTEKNNEKIEPLNDIKLAEDNSQFQKNNTVLEEESENKINEVNEKVEISAPSEAQVLLIDTQEEAFEKHKMCNVEEQMESNLLPNTLEEIVANESENVFISSSKDNLYSENLVASDEQLNNKQPLCKEKLDLTNREYCQNITLSTDIVSLNNNTSEQCNQNSVFETLQETGEITDEGSKDILLLSKNVPSNETLPNLIQKADVYVEEEVTTNDEHLDSEILSRHLEFYQNGDVHLIKENMAEARKSFDNQNPQLSKHMNELRDDFPSQFYNRFPKKEAKFTCHWGQRSSSCPRQLPSLSSKMLDTRSNGKVRKRRNSAESGTLSETSVPLKLRKTLDSDSNDDCDNLGQIENFIENTDNQIPSSCPSNKPRESLKRSKR